MSNKDDFEIVRGSGNVFRDFGYPNADAEQLKALLAAQIITVLDERNLSVRAAGIATGFAAADFSRIRQVKLDRFTIDRLMAILYKLGRRVEVRITVAPQVTKNTIHIIPHGDGWAMRREGAARISGAFETQSQALKAARPAAQRERAAVVTHGRDGRIRESAAYGREHRRVGQVADLRAKK
jgi:predicted XRE-type DNA-binding protein